jgi:ATP-binding cassette, subfamily B, bacterial
MKENFRNYFRFAKYAYPYWDKILLSFFIENCVYLIVILPPLVLRVLFDYAYPNKDIKLLIIFSVLPFLLFALVNILQVLRSFLDLYLSQSIFKNFYSILYAKIQHLPMRFFHNIKVGDLMYRMTDDLQIIENSVLTLIPKFSGSLLRLIAILAICFTMNVSLTLLALLSVPLYFLQTYYFANRMKVIIRENQEKNAMIFDLLEERLTNIKLIKLFQRVAIGVEELLKQISVLFVIERKAKITTSAHQLVSTLLKRFWIFVLSLYTGVCIIKGELTIGEVVAISTFFTMLQTPFESFSQIYKRFITAQVSFKRILDILDYPSEAVEINRDCDLKESIKLDGDINFEKVNFGYEKDKKILKDISFNIDKGSAVAIVGRSGIGKSSIIDMLLRFYPINNGKILIDNINIENISLVSLRNQIGLITQNDCLFNGTIKENITFGYEKEYSEKDVINAAKKADAHNFIMDMTNGYDSEVGPRGACLSSGERQRIAIARVLFRDPKILIFDEATSSLDTQSTKEIYATLEKFHGKKTVIIITHHLSTIRNIDQVIVIGNNGCISEKGSVSELIKRKGLFYKMYELQLGGFNQFISHLEFSLKAIRHNKNPFIVGTINIANYLEIEKAGKKNQMERFIDDLGITLSFLLRDIDYCTYKENGEFWVAFPDIDLSIAKEKCSRLVDYIMQTKFSDLSKSKLVLKYKLLECNDKDNIHTITTKIKEAKFNE